MEETKLAAMEPKLVAAEAVDKSKDSSVQPLVDQQRLELNKRMALVPRSSMEPVSNN